MNIYNLPPYRMAQLTEHQRHQLEVLDRSSTKYTQDDLARLVKTTQSTISREFKRHRSRTQKRYTATTAQQQSEASRQAAYCNRQHWYDIPRLYIEVIFELYDGKSPEQIAGRIKQQGWNQTVSHQAIYDYIERDKQNGGELYKLLRYQGKKHKWRGMNNTTNRIPNRNDIADRPVEVENKERPGDWESDLVVSCKSGSGAVATFTERTCLYIQAIVVESQSADEMVRATVEALGDLPEEIRETMTHDNGKEICKHEEITKLLDMPVYCARPYRSCDRGLNEWYNRELRRFFPKGTDFSKVTQKEIDAVVDWLNNCPRKSLGYRTPKEIFDQQLAIMHFTL